MACKAGCVEERMNSCANGAKAPVEPSLDSDPIGAVQGDLLNGKIC